MVTYGKKSKDAHGLGKTFPGVATPFGLVQLSPDTYSEARDQAQAIPIMWCISIVSLVKLWRSLVCVMLSCLM